MQCGMGNHVDSYRLRAELRPPEVFSRIRATATDGQLSSGCDWDLGKTMLATCRGFAVQPAGAQPLLMTPHTAWLYPCKLLRAALRPQQGQCRSLGCQTEGCHAAKRRAEAAVAPTSSA